MMSSRGVELPQRASEKGCLDPESSLILFDTFRSLLMLMREAPQTSNHSLTFINSQNVLHFSRFQTTVSGPQRMGPCWPRRGSN